MAGQGMGRRRQGPTDPARPDDRNRALERELETAAELEARGEVHERGRQPGAHGNRSPHREIKPGTRRDLENIDVDR